MTADVEHPRGSLQGAGVRTADATAASDPEASPATPAADTTVSNAALSNIALTLVGLATALFLLRYTRDVLIPFAVAALLFYALDPAVDWMQKKRVPRSIGALLAIMVLIGTSAPSPIPFRTMWSRRSTSCPAGLVSSRRCSGMTVR